MFQHYCSNELVVTGPVADVAAFVHTVEGDEDLLTFQRLVPEPGFAGISGAKGWLNWRMAHWGCKWDALDVERSQTSRTAVRYNYETGFGVAVNPIREASFTWPELTFALSYAAPGDRYAGAITFRAGAVLEERRGSYSDISAEDPLGTEPDPLHFASLSVVCARLRLVDTADDVDAFRETLRADGSGRSEDAAATLLRLGDPGILSEYCRRPETGPDGIWELLARAVGDVRGGRVLLALRRNGDARLSLLAGVLSDLQPLLLTPGDVLDDGIDIADRDRISALRQKLDAAEREGDLEGFAETAKGLATNWDGSSFDDLLDAAWRLHF